MRFEGYSPSVTRVSKGEASVDPGEKLVAQRTRIMTLKTDLARHTIGEIGKIAQEASPMAVELLA